MKQSTIQIVYYSITNHKVTPDFITTILEHARVSNINKNITGCLIYYNNIFLQLLEGKEENVESLFSKIIKDNRHKEVTLVYKEKISKRIFPNWSMAYHAFDKNSNEAQQFIKSIQFFSENNEKQTEAVELFWNMAKQIVK